MLVCAYPHFLVVDRSLHSNPAAETGRHFAACYILTAALPTWWHFWQVLPVGDALAVGSTVVIAAALAALLVGWTGRKGWLPLQVLLVGVVAALVLLNVDLMFARLPAGLDAAISALGGVLAAGVFSICRRVVGTRSRGFMVTALFAVLAALPVPAITAAAGRLPSLPGVADVVMPVTVDPLDYVQVPEFVEHPDVYIIGMLAAVPDSLLKRHLAVGPSPLNAYLEGGDFHVLHNVFSESYPTRNSLDMILSLHRDYLLDLGNHVAGELVSGLRPSPLLTIFAKNGYETNALYEDTKFGPVKGPYLDHYELAMQPSLCRDNFVDSAIRDSAFFGACRLSKAFPLSLLRPSLDDVFTSHLARLAEIATRGRPQLTILQLRPPFHYTGEKLAGADPGAVKAFASRYLRSAEQAAANLERLVRQVRMTDPDGLIFVFGDQGLGLAQDLTAEARTPFFVQDKLGVVGALFPAGSCAQYLPTPDSPTGVTTVEIVADLISCIAGGKSVYLPGYEHRALIGGETFALSPYVYE